MAIGTIHTEWLCHLKAKGALPKDARVLDLGPQDVQLPATHLRDLAVRHLPAKQVEPWLARILTDGQVTPTCQAAFYEVFGGREYRSLDVEDKRADYRFDLSRPLPEDIGQYDIVTNFGTTEHVFNIGQAFSTIHDLLLPGGVSLHVVPSFAFINHGFFNVHPNLYIEMARQNGYEVVDFSYVDNTFVRNQMLDQDPASRFDFRKLPIQLADMENTQSFMTKVAGLFLKNLSATDTRDALYRLSPEAAARPGHAFPSESFHICFVFDLCFVALRKRRAGRGDFVMPIQDAQGVKPLRTESRSLISRIPFLSHWIRD